MRIVKEFNLGNLKCTLLHFNEKYTLRIEDEFGEVNYKLGTIEISDTDSLSDYFEIPAIRNSLSSAFRSMKEGRDQLVHLLSNDEEDEFEEIV